MRMARLKADPQSPTAFYHCISRVVDRRFIFGDVERDHFVTLMRLYEAFCGVHVLTYAVMSNHFHILVEAPRRPDVMPSQEVLLKRIEALHSPLYADNVRSLLHSMTEADAQKHLQGYWKRMYDVSWFIRLIKQRFSQWYNGRKRRCGTLWEQRFKSVLVEGSGDVLATIAAYIDLNPVRVGLVADPKDYRWCGYAEAIAGGALAQNGIRLVMKGLERRKWEGVLEGYRLWLFGQAHEVRGHGGISPADVERVVREKGGLPLWEYLLCSVRYFVDGAVIGRRGYVEEIFASQRWRFGRRRKTGARPLRGLDGIELFSLSNLRSRVLKCPRGAQRIQPSVS